MNYAVARFSAALLCLTPLATTQASIFIDGAVTFGGVAILDNPNSALATQVTISFQTVLGVAGDYAPAVSVGQTPVITSPLVLGTTPATLWTVGGFTFTPTAPLVGGGGPNNTFSIGVLGIVDDGPGGLAPTAAVFSLAASPTAQGIGAFASTTSSGQPPGPIIPEPSAYALIGTLGLAAFASYRRFRR